MQKINKNILEMNDSTNLNEKELTENTLSPIQNVLANEGGATPAENTVTDGKRTAVGKVTGIEDNNVFIDFGKGNPSVIPMIDFIAHIAVGDTVNAVFEDKGDDVVIEIISYGKFGATDKPQTVLGVEAQETSTKASEELEAAENSAVEESSKQEKTESDVKLNFIDKDFLLDCMSVPTHSKLEYRMVAYIIMWARRNNITYEFDEFGNVYLTKGELEEGEFYPCVTSHLDTVQTKHDPYIYAGVPLELNVSEVVNQGVTEHKVSVNNEGGSEIGIGADDKGGICICLAMFEHLDKLKACFFLDEETGCHGSDHLEEDWFKDVGYVIGFDSPDLYRAAWACSGTQLFSYEFYSQYMKEVCDSWGLTKGCFFSEPYTDVKNIREKTDIICMNFGNGGYNAHNVGGTEYCIMEHMDQACGMGIELVEKIGNTRHMLKYTGRYNATNPTYQIDTREIHLLEQLGDNTRNGYKPTGSTINSYSSSSGSSINTKSTVSKDDEIKFETVKYIVEKYDSLIENIKEDVFATVKTLCESNNIDFNIFEKSLTENFSNEIKF